MPIMSSSPITNSIAQGTRNKGCKSCEDLSGTFKILLDTVDLDQGSATGGLWATCCPQGIFVDRKAPLNLQFMWPDT